MFDVAIIGCGIVGAAMAESLAHYKLNVLILEKENDVCMGASKANSAIIHAGYDAKPGTLMSKLNVQGSLLAKQLCQKYNVLYRQIGSLVLAFNSQHQKILEKLYQQGVKAGVPNMALWDKEKIEEEEPLVSKNAMQALYAPSAAIIEPWDYCLALAQVAVQNGATLLLNRQVNAICKVENGFVISAGEEKFESRFVVNAAGTNADSVHNLALKPSFKIIPNKGEYYLLDKTENGKIKHTIFQCPSPHGKGVLVSPTVHGNLIVGPSAAQIDNAQNLATTKNGLAYVSAQALKTFPGINYAAAIRNFSGVRAVADVPDFIIERSGNWVDLAGIKSPGLSAAPAIAKMALALLKDAGLCLQEKESFNPKRPNLRFAHLTAEEKQRIVKENPDFGRIICRCENISEGEILNALNTNIPPVSLDGIKRRCGPGMGRCQGGFCGPRVLELLVKKAGMHPLKVPMDAAGSFILTDDMRKRGQSHV